MIHGARLDPPASGGCCSLSCFALCDDIPRARRAWRHHPGARPSQERDHPSSLLELGALMRRDYRVHGSREPKHLLLHGTSGHATIRRAACSPSGGSTLPAPPRPSESAIDEDALGDSLSTDRAPRELPGVDETAGLLNPAGFTRLQNSGRIGRPSDSVTYPS